MHRLAELQTDKGSRTIIQYDFETRIADLARKGELDCVIFATADGFSPLGAARHFLAGDLGVDEQRISAIAHWNRSDNPAISLVGIRSQNPDSFLKGVVLAPCETSACYRPYQLKECGRPYRDFYYNVTYESLAYACGRLGARRLAIAHLSGSQKFHEDIATCNAEALAHYLEEPESPEVESFSFVGCCIEPHHLTGIRCLNAEGGSHHRPIVVKQSVRDGFDVMTLEFDG